MKKGILLLSIFFCLAVTAQKDSKFRSWSASLYGGTNWQIGNELPSLSGVDSKVFNYYASLEVTKYLNHVVGIYGKYAMGESYGSSELYSTFQFNESEFSTVSIGGELNLSNLFKRQDRIKEEKKWALLANAGVGFIMYETNRYQQPIGMEPSLVDFYKSYGDGKSLFKTLYYDLGVTLKYKLSKSFDLALRTTLIETTDPEYDACASNGFTFENCALDTDEEEDSLLGIQLGVTYKIGKNKNQDHLMWTFPVYGGKADKTPLLDTDGDGVADIFDIEPDTPQGAKVYGDGSSIDIDNDGFADYNDECPTQAGVAELNGCPPREDRDGDGIFDDEDDCPNTPGVKEKAGCEAVSERELNALFDKILFDTGKSSIKAVSFGDLEQIANILSQDGDSKWLVEGHTDSRGDYNKNMRLSDARALSVVEALVQRGVSRSRLQSKGYGPDQPRADNATADGRQLNRRVQLKAIK